AFTIHCRPVAEKPRPLWMDGRATLTIETSRITMNWARQTISKSGVFEARRGAEKLWIALMGALWDPRYPSSRERFILVVDMPPSAPVTTVENGARPVREPAASGQLRREELADFLRMRRAA